MPKSKNKSSLLSSYVKQFGEEVFQTNGKIILCKLCNKSFGSEKNEPRKSQIEQHVNTSFHQKHLQLKGKKHQMIEFKEQNSNDFNMELCELFVSCDIPLNKLLNEKMKNFFKNQFQVILPDPSTLRKTKLPVLYQQTIDRIKMEVGNEKIWISIDESTDCTGRSIGNVVVGILNKEKSKQFLLTTEVLEQSNHSTIAQLFTKSMILIYENEIKHENVFLFLTDAAPYMIKAAKGFKVSYPKMIHLTCLVHGLHRVAESIRFSFPEVNQLISNVKKTFKKAPSRKSLFKEKSNGIPLPPEPIATRWCTWLSAVLYYSKHFNFIKEIFDQLNEKEADAIGATKELLKNKRIKTNLAFISTNFCTLINSIKKLEKRNLRLYDSMKIIQDEIQNIKSSNFKKATDKLDFVLENNHGFIKICLINKIINGEEVDDEDREKLENIYSPEELTYFKFAPITSCEVERSFSKYKTILTDNRQSFCFENLKMTFVINCNASNFD